MPYAKHIVIAEDTLPQLAQRYLGDTNRWMEIAILNDLEYPFIVNEERNENTPPKVKAIGETLLIPIEESLENAPFPVLQQTYDQSLGTDIDVLSWMYNPYSETYVNLTQGEQAEMNADTYGDIKTTNGLRNLQQALLLRLMTPQGSLLHHPEYGSKIHDMLGQAGTENQLQKIKIELERTIRSDGRVEDVTVESITFDGQVVYVSIAIKPVGIDRVIQLGLHLQTTGVITWASA